MDYNRLAELLFPDVTLTPDDMEAKYPERDLPEGAKILVQRDGSRSPLEGVLNGDEESTKAFLNGIMGFSYAGKDKDGNDVNITLFANSMTERGHQRDEYAFISNALFASFLTETPYVTGSGE